MKKNFIQMRRLLLTTIAGLLGISTASCAKYGTLEAEYGCPEADFDLSGYVTDRGGNPIEGIEVKHTYRTDTTDEAGYYHIPKHVEFPDRELHISFRDVDGEEHGAYRDTTVTVKVDHNEYRGGNDNWYEGTLTKEVNMTLEPKTDK